jgi:hypothetical protein
MVAQTFTGITSRPCHCSIKLFVENDHVSTKARDVLSHNHARRSVDEHKKSYPYRENTAFKRIIDEDARWFYIENDLATAAARGEYINSNSNWRDHYNATVVVPITEHENPAAVTRASCLGFLTADSATAHFEQDISLAILRQYALRINDTLILLGKAQPNQQQRR